MKAKHKSGLKMQISSLGKIIPPHTYRVCRSYLGALQILSCVSVVAVSFACVEDSNNGQHAMRPKARRCFSWALTTRHNAGSCEMFPIPVTEVYQLIYAKGL